MEDDGELDLMVALGAPEASGDSKEKGKEQGKGGYLDSKDPMLVGHLMDAVDDALSPEERAEALCRAIEASRAPAPMGDEMMPGADY